MYQLDWSRECEQEYLRLEKQAHQACASRKESGKTKASKQEGLFKQVKKCFKLLANDPKHPGLNSHEFKSLPHPWDPSQKVFEVYVQNNTPGAYRLFWCYGRDKGRIYLIALTAHP